MIPEELLLTLRPKIISQSYKYPFYCREDLVQEGFIGAMRAIQNFDPSKNVPLIVYATYYIRDFMLAYYKKVYIKHTAYTFIEELHDTESQNYIETIYQEQVKSRLPEAMNSLDGRQQDIIKRRYMQDKPTYLHVIGKEYGISENRTQQVEQQALTKLRKYFE